MNSNEELLTTDEMASRIADCVANLFGGVVPPFPAEIAIAVAKVCFPEESREEVLQSYFDAIVPALQARIAAQDADWIS